MFLIKDNLGFNSIIYKEFLLLMVTSFFRMWTSQLQSPLKSYIQSQQSSILLHTHPPPPPPLQKRQGQEMHEAIRKLVIFLVSNLLSTSQVTTC